MTWLVALGGAGGVISVLAAIIVIGRGIFRQVSATESLTETMDKLNVTVGRLEGLFNDHETRISVLEDRVRR